MLRSPGISPAPRHSQITWREFVRQHAAQMLATHFSTVEPAWRHRLHVLFFIELASRKVHLGGITASPTGEWVAQQAWNLAAEGAGRRREGPVPAPRSRQQVHRCLRSGLPLGRRESFAAATL